MSAMNHDLHRKIQIAANFKIYPDDKDPNYRGYLEWMHQRKYVAQIYLNSDDVHSKAECIRRIDACNENIKQILGIW